MKEENPDKDSAGKFIKGHQLNSITEEDLETLVGDYCEHRAKGLDKQSFKGCDYRTIERNASIMQTEQIRIAEAEGWLLWETIAMNIALGITEELPDGRKVDPKKTNVTMIIFMIRNKMNSQYGERQDGAGKRDDPDNPTKPAAPTSTTFTIKDNESGKEIELNIGGTIKKTT